MLLAVGYVVKPWQYRPKVTRILRSLLRQQRGVLLIVARSEALRLVLVKLRAVIELLEVRPDRSLVALLLSLRLSRSVGFMPQVRARYRWTLRGVLLSSEAGIVRARANRRTRLLRREVVWPLCLDTCEAG